METQNGRFSSALLIMIAVICSVCPPVQAQTQSAGRIGQADRALLARAKGGDTASQLALANCYENGTCASMNLDQALVWYRKAAEGGNATAQFIIGWEFYDGSGADLAPKNHLPKDPSQSAAWFRRASEHADLIDFALLKDGPPSARAVGGEPDVDFLLGSLFEDGKDLPQDYSQAAFWYRRAAERGHVYAQSSLGSLYAEGNGVPQDFGQAAEWLRRAADKGESDAEVNLATLYLDGNGVVQNYQEARQLLLKALEKGDAQAAFNLGVIYGKGLGVPQSPSAAYFFFAISAAGGHGTEQKEATKARDLVATLLTTEQISDSRKKRRNGLLPTRRCECHSSKKVEGKYDISLLSLPPRQI